jgi:amidophosphoribosyltransferase
MRDIWLDDSPHDECGVFGIYAPEMDVARLTFFSLFALQHRGQESAGIAVTDGARLIVHKDMGLVSQVFEEGTLQTLPGQLAIGHVRYSTTGSSEMRNAQPFARTRNGSFISGHSLSGTVTSSRAPPTPKSSRRS